MIKNRGQLEEDLKTVEKLLSERDSLREKVIVLTREIIRASGEVVKLVHRGELELAEERSLRLRELVGELKRVASGDPELYYSGLVYNALSEYVEAVEFLSIVRRGLYVSLGELGVPPAPFLQGLGDLVGELKRYVLALLDKGELDRAKGFIELMQDLRDYLRRFEMFPDAIVPGLRHKVDVASRLIEDVNELYLHSKNTRLVQEAVEKARRES